MVDQTNNLYYKVLQWLLNEINGELFETQESLKRIQDNLVTGNSVTFNERENGPEDLIEVLFEVQSIEKITFSVTKLLLGDVWDPPVSLPRIDISPSEPIEEIFAFLLPRIDSHLNNIETTIYKINKLCTHAKLEPIPPASIEQTASERQTRFVDKTKRIRCNVSLLEDKICSKQKKQITEPYKVPVWSVAPKQKFYFEFRKGDVIEERLLINEQGNYLIGRLSVCDIVINDPTCSRQHCAIQFRPGDPSIDTGHRIDEAYIFDLKSTSGTYLNGALLLPKVYYPLCSGDTVQLGEYPVLLVFRDGNEEGLIPPTPRKKITNEKQKNLQKSPREPNNNQQKSLHEKKDVREPKKSLRRVKTLKKMKNSPRKSLSDSQDDLHKLEVATKTISANISPAIEHKHDEETTKKIKTSSDSESFLEENTEYLMQSVAVQKPNELVPKSQDHIAASQSSFSLGEKLRFVDEVSKPRSVPSIMDPTSKTFNEEDYKAQMIQAYEKQQRENAEILRKRKEREALGLPPLVEIPFVPERTKSGPTPVSKQASTPKKKKRWWKK